MIKHAATLSSATTMKRLRAGIGMSFLIPALAGLVEKYGPELVNYAVNKIRSFRSKTGSVEEPKVQYRMQR